MKYTQAIPRSLILTLSLIAVVFTSNGLFAGQLKVAVASNFDVTLEELRQEFERLSGHSLTMTPGTSASLYSRIIDGEAFDIFLSADTVRPQVLEKENRTIPGTRFTYAFSRIVLWSIRSRNITPEVLQDSQFQLLAIANPRLDPFGQAAMEVLQKLNIWDAVQDKLVVGENIGQTYNFAISENVDVAFVAYSQIIYGEYMQAGSYWQIPDNYYTPIEQQGVLLTDNPAAREFMQFMQSEHGKSIIRSNGFNVPDAY